MKFKGPWDGTKTYAVGDAVTFTDGGVYHLQKLCKAGTEPIDTNFWGKVSQEAGEIVIMLLDVIASIPNNINDEGIVLKGTDDAEYLITVDDSGETPELAVDPIEDGD